MMSNQNDEQMQEEENNNDDNVSCVTSISRMTYETESLSNIERELLHLPVLFYSSMNNGNVVQLRQLIMKYFTEDCMLQSPTMETPVFGVHHVITLVTGVIQNLPDFVISATNIQLMNREVISGSIDSPRCIVFERNFEGK